jgi:Astacin (Peptidase family M12A)
MRSTYRFLGLLALSLGLASTGCSKAQDELDSQVSPMNCVDGVCFEEKNGLAVYQGDIILGSLADLKTGSIATKAFAIQETYGSGYDSWTATPTWPGGLVRYQFDANVAASDRANIVAAMGRVAAALPTIRFVTTASMPYYGNWDDSPPPVLSIHNSADPNACFVNQVGNHGGGHMSIVPGVAGCIVHELGHVLGLWHEQARTDRDQFVTINWENITPGREFQFLTQPGRALNPYDTDSVMHYESIAFSRNGLPTITPRNPKRVLRYGVDLSRGDIEGLNILYPVPAAEPWGGGP